ncbi:MAG: porin [Candidatus Thiodiazotropha sp. (ex Epidulcina cf. delphinae)]|nr:porin [Candidatus Thiodiazotropha sp. (ex Epidulcina cf. delphinae)]
MKKVLSLAIAAALVAPVAAVADATIYGKVRQSLDIVSDERISGADEVDNIQINNRTSRLGVKGSEDLGNGLTAVYKIEYGVNISTNPGGDEFSGDGSLGARNAFVGLAGDFGTIVLGRHDTPLKISTGSLDYFGDTVVDNNTSYTESLVDRRADGTLAYISPNLNGVTLAAAVIPGENSEADGLADAYSLAAMYSNAGIFASLAYEGADGNIDALPVNAAGQDRGDLDQFRAGFGYDGGMFKVGVVFENVTIENEAGGDDLRDSDSVMVNGAIKAGPGMVALKIFDYADDSDDTNDHDGFGIGYHYGLSKRTQVMANYVDSSFDNLAGDVSILSLQVNHNF